MSSVRSTSLFWGLVDLDVLDNQVSGVKTFNIGIGFGVLEESKEEFSGFDWMASTGYTELFAYRKRKSAI
jgi:lipoprotein signal peptidase